MAEDALPSPVDRNSQPVGRNDLRQLHCDMRKHVVVYCVGRVGCVEVEPGAGTEIPIFIFTLDTRTTGRGVREKDGDTLFRSWTEEATLLSAGD